MSVTTMPGSPIPRPLLGDDQGRYRVLITGNSGSGKSTLGAEMAALLGVPYISLDVLFWQPGWEITPTDEFRAKVRAALDRADGGWVVDGNYTSRLGTMVHDEATDIIWLDPPLALYLPRLCLRTLGRLLGYSPQCRAGCPERWREVFSRESIVWLSLTHHWTLRKREGGRWAVDGTHKGGKRRRIGGWGSELAEWKESVRQMIHCRSA